MSWLSQIHNTPESQQQSSWHLNNSTIQHLRLPCLAAGPHLTHWTLHWQPAHFTRWLILYPSTMWNLMTHFCLQTCRKHRGLLPNAWTWSQFCWMCTACVCVFVRARMPLSSLLWFLVVAATVKWNMLVRHDVKTSSSSINRLQQLHTSLQSIKQHQMVYLLA